MRFSNIKTKTYTLVLKHIQYHIEIFQYQNENSLSLQYRIQYQNKYIPYRIEFFAIKINKYTLALYFFHS